MKHFITVWKFLHFQNDLCFSNMFLKEARLSVSWRKCELTQTSYTFVQRKKKKNKINQIYVLTEVFESVCHRELASSGWDSCSVRERSSQRNPPSRGTAAVFLPGRGALPVARITRAKCIK